MLNKAILMGRLTRDPELRYTQSNLPFIQFTIAVDRNYSGNGGERQTDFINIVAWRKTAEFVSQWFTKGMMIIVTGSIQSRNWQDKNGNNRTSIEVIADEVQFGETKKSREANSGYQGGYNNGGYQQNSGYGGNGYNQNSYNRPPQNPGYQQQSFNNRPNVDANDFSEISDDDGEVPF